jgi:hypothetical protein
MEESEEVELFNKDNGLVIGLRYTNKGKKKRDREMRIFIRMDEHYGKEVAAVRNKQNEISISTFSNILHKSNLVAKEGKRSLIANLNDLTSSLLYTVVELPCGVFINFVNLLQND